MKTEQSCVKGKVGFSVSVPESLLSVSCSELAAEEWVHAAFGELVDQVLSELERVLLR